MSVTTGQPTILIHALGESTYLGVNNTNVQPNAYNLPTMYAQFLGSIGVGNSIEAVNNKAVSGRTISDQQGATVVDSVTGLTVPGPLQPSQLSAVSGQLVLLNFGINDAWQWQTTDQFIANISAIAEICRLIGKTVVFQSPNKILSTVTYSDGTTLKNGLTCFQALAQFAANIKSLAASLGNVYVASNDRNDIPLSDAFHPTNIGYGYMRDDLVNSLPQGFINKLNAQLQVSLVYTSLLLRCPEASGSVYWVNKLTSGAFSWNDGSLINAFLLTPEAQGLYPTSLSSSDFIYRLYVRIFGREPLTSDQTYWQTQIAANGKAKAASDLIQAGASYALSGGTDAAGLVSCALVNNRAAVGLAYGVTLARTAIPATYPNGPLAGVTSDPQTILAAGRAM